MPAELAPGPFRDGRLINPRLARQRHHPALVAVVEELGEAAVDDPRYCSLTIIEIPDGLDYDIFITTARRPSF